MELALLDTDTLNEVLKRKNRSVVRRAAAYLQTHGEYAISGMSRFEVVRGLRHRGATKYLAKFDGFCARSFVASVSEQVLDRAADLWVIGRRGGHPHNDADLIIAATALDLGRTLVTGNAKHFNWIEGLKLDNWRE